MSFVNTHDYCLLALIILLTGLGSLQYATTDDTDDTESRPNRLSLMHFIMSLRVLLGEFVGESHYLPSCSEGT